MSHYATTFIAVLALVQPAAAQIIQVRTVPIERSHQFDLIPSLTRAMGGVEIAIDDSLRDPFVSPAKGVGPHGSRFFLAPGFYHVGDGRGGGWSLPLGAMFRSGNWFGGAVIALQGSGAATGWSLGVPCPQCQQVGMDLVAPDRRQGNRHGLMTLGRAFPRSNLSLGASVSWSDVGWLYGVDQLYAGAARITQHSNDLDVRLAALKTFGGDRKLNLVAVRDRFSSSHDVLFVDFDRATSQATPRLEENADRTDIWGLHLQYTQPWGTTGWRVGATSTINLMNHPKIPNYVLQNIPFDPGHTRAFGFGLGVARERDGTAVAFDLVVEPIRSHTWGEAPSPLATPNGLVPAGGKTVENWFRFGNVALKGGFAHQFPLERNQAVGIRFGLGVQSVQYSLAQSNYLTGVDRRANQSWVEIKPTWGLSYRFAWGELHYRGSATGRSLSDILGTRGDDVTVADPGPIVAAPNVDAGSLFRSVITSHQFSLSIPIR